VTQNQPSPAGFIVQVLKVQGAEGPGQDIRFSADVDCIRLGRNDDCDVVLADVTVSRHHAEILRTRKGYLLLDSGSANGVWIDNERVQEHLLSDGQQFRLGGAVLLFKAAPAAVAEPPRPAAPPPQPPPPPVSQEPTSPPVAPPPPERKESAQEALARDIAAREAELKAQREREQAQREAEARAQAQLEAATRARQEAEAREAAEQRAREEAAQREAAERQAREQAAQREAAEQKAREEAARREAAEQQAREEAARQAAAAAPAAAPPAAAEDEEDEAEARARARQAKRDEAVRDAVLQEEEDAEAVDIEVSPDIQRAPDTPVNREIIARGMHLIADGMRPFLLDGQDTAWFVESGKVEVFTVGVEDGAPVGARSHFVTVEPGEFMFGMDLEGYAMGSGFLAVGRIGTSLRQINISVLQQLAGNPEYRDDLAEMLDHWVNNLSRSLTKEIIPGPLVDVNLVEGGEQTELLNQQKARSNKDVLWLEVVDGNLLFIGMEELLFWQEKAKDQSLHHSIQVNLQDLFAMAQESQQVQALFPVTTDTWIEASNARDLTTRIKSYTASEVVADAGTWKGLEIFHEVLCQCEFINKKLAAVDEFNRLKTKAEYSKAAEKAAYQEIAMVLEQPESEEAVAGPGEEADPVFSACKLVGEALGMRIVQHPDANRDAKVDDRVAAIAKASQFRVRTIALRGSWWKQDQGPIFAKTEEGGRPIALLPTSPRSYEAIDTITGEKRKVNARVADEIDLFGLAFYRPFPDGAINAKKLIKFGALGLGREVRMLIMMGVGLGFLGALVPMFTGKLFDTAIPQADRNLLAQYTSALFVGAIVTAAFKITQSIATLRVQGKMDYSIQAALWDRLLKLSSSFFRDYSSGDLADRAGGVNQIRGLVAGAGISAILGSLSSVFYVVLLFMYSLHLAGLAMGLTLVFVSFSFTMNLLQLRYQRQMMWIRGKITGLVLQFVSGVGKLRVAGAENHAFRVWAREYAAQRRLEFSIGRVQNNVAVFNSSFPIFSSMAIFYVLMTVQKSAEAQGGAPPLSTGEFIAFNAAYTAFITAMIALSDASLNLLRAVPIYERLKPILTAEPEVDESKAYPGRLKGEIELSHCHFRYIDDGPWVIDDVSLRLRPGEFIAFVGSSGCGKSTLMRLMLGFETPDKGSVYYDGQDLASLDVREVRQQLGVVLQDSKLLPADVFRNIIGTADLTIDDAWDAARMAGLEDDIRKLPMQMHTYVSEGGGGFSGGQQQRMLIARALVRRPRVIFMDEATSALDNRSQAIVTESMERMQATRIAIAHRLSTIINADRICYMHQGKIAEIGPFEELMKLKGRFYELARRQLA
jgi:ATP-binding cassette subfamily C protein